MLLTGLAVHPVKSTTIRPVESARVLRGGLEGDRTWVVVDPDGVIVTAREAHSLFTIVADTPATDPDLEAALRLRAPDMGDLLLSEPSGERSRVRLFSQELEGIPAGPEADEWVQKALGRDGLRLLWCDDPTRRNLNPAFGRPEDFTAYADGYPVTIASESSLRQLNDWIVEGALHRGEDASDPLPMKRFRPNLTVDGESPFGEDDWDSVQIGEVRFRVAKPTDRCVITTIDIDSLSTDKEPIRTLSRHRLVDQRPLFALSLIPETTGVIHVGDSVTVT